MDFGMAAVGGQAVIFQFEHSVPASKAPGNPFDGIVDGEVTEPSASRKGMCPFRSCSVTTEPELACILSKRCWV